MEPALLYPYFLEHPAISTDTRNIQPNSLFFALKGENFNGNAFAGEALEKGARYAVIDEPQYQTDERFLLVADVLTALQELARHHRHQLRIPIVGITGTNGKTTTKELIHAVLSQQFNTLATTGNLNNHIGVPLTMLAITEQTEIAIIEMGANHVGEIALLCGIAQPTHGLITNVGKAHLEGFGSFEGVKKAKGELYDYLATHNGTLFLQNDNPLLHEMAAARRVPQVVTYGFSVGNDVVGELVSADPLLNVSWKLQAAATPHITPTQLTGSYNTENILAAVCVGQHFNVPPAKINRGIAEYTPKNNRSQLTKTEHNTIICDYYNANATSMAAALDNLRMLKAERKVVILGDMFELGAESHTEHHQVVQHALSLEVYRLIFVGEAFFEHCFAGAEFYKTTAEAQAMLQQQPITDALVLLKASRGMAFEQLVSYL
ncbi:UDP-N-acetylmuramoyl-tripeptide--D-alanyl-D-alanine ligase [Parapedobacter pyrenivorans]|uniref:UDP-N-acetylmuramoyl-tripeptide--D-alanyl-D-alanine ligase n=1 Tax=Parapedobacter pyrenivorans TaxID=1305674 RepID=A0A917HK66_9SPHI|nr:UDP-N-acetylmuramoyl-tripeptide--D-alanyl-D-alanine ligase [Parapedobacter pyrenivorans]GGG81321.1 UDP-N-acetylmuramoyl-tripeptide--D-alanyl-D-alanine ligase [Parapedobacter pyrenivorans]